MASPELGTSTQAAAASAGAPDPTLRRKLVWLTFFRLVTITVLLAGIALTSRRSSGELEAAGPLYAIIVVTYLASLATAVLLRRGRGFTALAYGQIALDVALAAGVVAVTGRSESVFVFLFTLAIVNGAILLYTRGAVTAALTALAVYAALALGPDAPGRVLSRTTLFAHGSAFAAIAALASYLSAQLRRTGERLAARESDLAAITAIHEAIVQSVASGLVTLDAGGKVTFLNRAGEQITGMRLEDVQGSPAGGSLSVFGESRRGETEFLNARGDKRHLGYARFPLLGRSGEEIGSAVIFQDLTEMRAMEQRVERSERLAELGRVAAGLAHELRNPLASISGSVELLRAGSGLRADERRLMDIVLREADRLDNLVARFLEWSRPAPPRRERTDLARLARETLAVFQNDPASARVRVEPDLATATVSCDPDQMRQVLWNLLANAVQAADGAGSHVRVSCAADAGGARLVVADDGPGIAAADVPRIFQPFFTTRRDGTGLGLATVQRIVDAHGGTIEVDSAPGRGAAFTVRLPAAAPPGAAEG